MENITIYIQKSVGVFMSKASKCPKCYQSVKTLNGKVQDHKITIILSSGNPTKSSCPGVGKNAIY